MDEIREAIGNANGELSAALQCIGSLIALKEGKELRDLVALEANLCLVIGMLGLVDREAVSICNNHG